MSAVEKEYVIQLLILFCAQNVCAQALESLCDDNAQ